MSRIDIIFKQICHQNETHSGKKIQTLIHFKGLKSAMHAVYQQRN